MIDDVLNKHDASTIILKKLNNQLDVLHKTSYSLVVCNRKIDNLKIKCNEDIRWVEIIDA